MVFNIEYQSKSVIQFFNVYRRQAFFNWQIDVFYNNYD